MKKFYAISTLLLVFPILLTSCVYGLGALMDAKHLVSIAKALQMRRDPKTKPSQVLLIPKTSKNMVMIGTKPWSSPISEVYFKEQQYVGPGAVIEVFGETKLGGQKYNQVIATYYDGEIVNVINGWMPKVRIQQLILSDEVIRIQLTEGCPAECVAKKNMHKL